MILLDTDFVFSYFDSNQSTHLQALEIIKKLDPNQTFAISNLVKQELVTVVSYKIDKRSAIKVMDNLKYFEAEEIFITETDTAIIWDNLLNNKKLVSFVDISNLYLSKKLGAKIASFDQFYPKNLKVS